MTTKTTSQPAESKSFANPDNAREFSGGKIDILDIGGGKIARATLQPGWRWATDVKPQAKTDWCEVAHFEYHIRGTLHVVMSDGTEFDIHPGDVAFVPPGHDAWVVGDEPCVAVDWAALSTFALPD